jgi:hypothetical protein
VRSLKALFDEVECHTDNQLNFVGADSKLQMCYKIESIERKDKSSVVINITKEVDLGIIHLPEGPL